MSKSNYLETSLLELIFNATAISNLADDAASSPLTVLYVALHTGDPGEGGTQATNECTYTGYGRVAVDRDSGGWTVTDNSVSPVDTIQFGLCSSGNETATHWSIGVGASGATEMLYSGTVTPNISIAAGVTPQLANTSTVTED